MPTLCQTFQLPRPVQPQQWGPMAPGPAAPTLSPTLAALRKIHLISSLYSPIKHQMFKSASSKAKSVDLLNKLTHGLSSTSDQKPANSTERVSKQFHGPQKVTKKKLNKLVQRKLQQESKDLKRIKYELIKAKKEKSELSPEHEKYLKKLIRKNKNSLIDNEFDEEIGQLQEEILNYKKKERTRVKKNPVFAGLTPGLAPVDYNESESE